MLGVYNVHAVVCGNQSARGLVNYNTMAADTEAI